MVLSLALVPVTLNHRRTVLMSDHLQMRVDLMSMCRNAHTCRVLVINSCTREAQESYRSK